MRYPWLGLTIALIMFMAAFSVLSNPSTNPNVILGIALVAISILSLFGFRSPK